MLGCDGVEPVADRIEVAEHRVGTELDAGRPRVARAQQPRALDLWEVHQRRSKLGPERLGHLVGHDERRHAANGPASAKRVRSVRIDPRRQERQDADCDLQLRGRTGVDDDALVGRLGSLEELAAPARGRGRCRADRKLRGRPGPRRRR